MDMTEAMELGNNGRKKDVVDYLMDDPTKSDKEIAKNMKSYRQKVWRKKKQMEDEHVIWGYTAVVDEEKLNHPSYVVLLKTKPINSSVANRIIKHIVANPNFKEDVRVIDMCYLSGEYDWMIRFSAVDRIKARRFYEALRLFYEDYLCERPVIIDVSFCLITEGKRNPEMKKIIDFVSEAG